MNEFRELTSSELMATEGGNPAVGFALPILFALFGFFASEGFRDNMIKAFNAAGLALENLSDLINGIIVIVLGSPD